MSQKYCSKPCLYIKVKYTGFQGSTSREPDCQCKRYNKCGFSPWVKKFPWRRAWQPSPVFLPGESHGQRSLAGYSPRGFIELDTTERRSTHTVLVLGFPGGSDGNLPAMQETWVRSLGWEDPLEEGMATQSSILAWRIPWTEEPGGLQSIESQRVEHN